MFTLPFYVDEQLTVDTQLALVDKGVPRLSAVLGRSVATGERVAQITHDLPSLSAPLSKQDQELRDVLAFVRDVLDPAAAVGHAVRPNPNDPPDTLVLLNGRTYAVEAAQLVMPDARRGAAPISAWHVFETLRAQLLQAAEQDSVSLQQHKGTIVFVFFVDKQNPTKVTLPHRRPDDLVSLLRASTPSKPIADGPMPNPAPHDVVAWSPDQEVGITWGDLPAGYSSPTVTALGFELVLAHTVLTRMTFLCAELRRVIEQHDSAANDLLVITVNAPLRSGLHFPAAGVISKLLFEDATADLLGGWRPRALKNVVLHDPVERRHRILCGSLPH